MRSKVALLVGAGVGYVLGARAGHARYEQIAAKARGFWSSEPVQDATTQAQQFAREKAPQAAHKVSDAASRTVSAAKEKITHDDQASGAPDPYAAPAITDPAGLGTKPGRI